MTDDLVERVARAMFGLKPMVWETTPKAILETYRQMARAAIAAIEAGGFVIVPDPSEVTIRRG